MAHFLDKKYPMQPDWHKDINPNGLIPIYGHFFKFEGVDPNKPEVLFMKYEGPSKRRNERGKQNGN